MRLCVICAICTALAWAANVPANALRNARDRQDLTALDHLIAQAARGNISSSAAQYRIALANSYAAEVAMELHQKKKAESYAEAGIGAAQKAVAQNDSNPEYHRLLGQLCGQAIPASPIWGTLEYGQCASGEIKKAIALNGHYALAYVTEGVGSYYLPQAMGGGAGLALKDFDKAIALNPRLAEAYLWKGLALRKQNRNQEARAALERALQLDPKRLWTKQELDKTPQR
ncbi:MAG: tetratricopeptide repeat protein [Bryobacteraceae bacterium]